MKKEFLWSVLAFAILTSCSSSDSNEEEPINMNEKFTGVVNLTVEPYTYADTRTSLVMDEDNIKTEWYNFESIGLFHILPDTCFHFKQMLKDGKSASVNGEDWALLHGNKYAVYYPCTTFVPELTYKYVPMIMEEELQNGNDNLKHIDGTNDFMYANAKVPEGDLVEFKFKHVTSIIELDLTMPTDASWTSVKLANKNRDDVFVTTATVNALDGSIISLDTQADVTLRLVNIKTTLYNKNIKVYLTVLPTTTGELTLTATTSENKRYTTTLESKKIESGKVYRYVASPNTAELTGTENNHEWIDLGLPSGTLWATTNLGADYSYEYGNYFAWGETEPQENNEYNWSSYKWCSDGTEKGITKYTADDQVWTAIWYSKGEFVGDGMNTLEDEDDAATKNRGKAWCIPTIDQLTELTTRCTWTWNRQGVNKYGYTVKGPNGKSIFLPAGGVSSSNKNNSAGKNGLYASRNRYESETKYAYILHFDSDKRNANTLCNRCWGISIRPVCK